MDFSQVLNKLSEETYKCHFLNIMDGILANPEVQPLVQKWISLLYNYSKKDLTTYYDDFERSLFLDPCYGNCFFPDNPKGYLDQKIPMSYVILSLFFKISEIKTNSRQLQLEDYQITEMNQALKYLNRFFMKREALTIKYLVLSINYELDHCIGKEWSELNSDQLFVRAERLMNDASSFDDVVGALIRINVYDPLMQGEKEEIIARQYYINENYERALEHARLVIRPGAVDGLIIESYAMLGREDELISYISTNNIEHDEYQIAYLLLLLMKNIDLKKYNNSYSAAIDYIQEYLVDSDVLIIAASSKECVTTDTIPYYMTAFEMLTKWVEDYLEYELLLSSSCDDEISSIMEELSNRAVVFSVCDEELRNSIFRVLHNNPISIDGITAIYDEYIKRIPQGLSNYVCEFMRFYLRISRGKHIYDKALNYLKSTNCHYDTGMKALLFEAYISALSSNDSISCEFAALFNIFGLTEANISEISFRQAVRNSLSAKGKIEYDAACLYFDSINVDDYGNRDAGMVSMSFYRIIENESNERIWKPVANTIDIERLEEEYAQEIDALSGDAKSRFKLAWSKTIEQFKILRNNPINSNGFMLGPMYHLTQSITTPGSSPVANMVRSELLSKLTQYGIDQFEHGKLSEWYGDYNRNRYRNPPAHNRYVHLSVAVEAKNYVERELMVLKEMLL